MNCTNTGSRYKRKGDVHDPEKYTAITLLSHILKMLERILDGRIRRILECEMGEEQQGFRRGRGMVDGDVPSETTDGKKLEGQENMWMGVLEAEVRMVEGTYEETKG